MLGFWSYKVCPSCVACVCHQDVYIDKFIVVLGSHLLCADTRLYQHPRRSVQHQRLRRRITSFDHTVTVTHLRKCPLSTQEARKLILEMAATCSHSSGRKWPPAFSCNRQPLVATCSHSSGRKWPPAFSCHRQPLAATCSHSSGRKWPPAFSLSPAATCSRLQPLEWPQVAASILFSAAATRVAASGRQHSLLSGSHSSGRKWPPAFSCHRQPLAASCSHSSGRKWPQVAA